MKGFLEVALLSAAKAMWDLDITLSEYSDQTSEHELNLAFHYGCELRRWFPWFDCDFDVTKKHFSSKRPDLVLHRRNANRANFLVLEIKRARNRDEVSDDISKIRDNWFDPRLAYRFGVALVLDEEGRNAEVTVLERENDHGENVVRLGDLGEPFGRPDHQAQNVNEMRAMIERLVGDDDRSTFFELRASLDSLMRRAIH
jgi:hypothetical protein